MSLWSWIRRDGLLHIETCVLIAVTASRRSDGAEMRVDIPGCIRPYLGQTVGLPFYVFRDFYI